jgi:hypothetical protein
LVTSLHGLDREGGKRTMGLVLIRAYKEKLPKGLIQGTIVFFL